MSEISLEWMRGVRQHRMFAARSTKATTGAMCKAGCKRLVRVAIDVEFCPQCMEQLESIDRACESLGPLYASMKAEGLL